VSAGINNITSMPGMMPGRQVTGSSGGEASFADTLDGYLAEVNRLQSDASRAVRDFTTGETDDMAGMITAMEKSDVAFRTLLAIRTKLMDAYEELRNMPI
jgi:flagellar hook-basal body complex protein FliE